MIGPSLQSRACSPPSCSPSPRRFSSARTQQHACNSATLRFAREGKSAWAYNKLPSMASQDRLSSSVLIISPYATSIALDPLMLSQMPSFLPLSLDLYVLLLVCLLPLLHMKDSFFGHWSAYFTSVTHIVLHKSDMIEALHNPLVQIRISLTLHCWPTTAHASVKIMITDASSKVRQWWGILSCTACLLETGLNLSGQW